MYLDKIGCNLRDEESAVALVKVHLMMYRHPAERASVAGRGSAFLRNDSPVVWSRGPRKPK